MSINLNRRDFITHTSLLGAAAGLGVFSRASAQTPIKRAGKPRLKVSLNAYSFNRALTELAKDPKKGATIVDLIDYCAETNFDALDPTGYYFPGYPKVPSDKYINDFKRRAHVCGVAISGTGVRNDFTTSDKEKRAAGVQHVKEWVEVAAKLGAPVLRIFSGPEQEDQEWDKTAEHLVEELKKCVEHGQKHGVLIGIQNHGDFLKTSDQLLKIIKLVDSEWFGAVVDVQYFQGADPYKEIAAAAPFAVNWQIKENVDGKARKVPIDLKKTVRIIRDSGYRGYLPIETLPVSGEEYDPRVRAAKLLKELNTAIQETA